MPAGDLYSVTTPRGVVQLVGAGQYGILAGDSATPTRISVVGGSAQIASGSFSLRIGAGQTATVTGDDTLQGSVGPLDRGAFLSGWLRALVPPPPGPPAVRYMTGADSLAGYGTWQPSPQYGQVWYPRVAEGWAPYREGSWSYVAPWGWTWVDAEPWGFAPFHYGRWSQFDGRWGWVPAAPNAPPDVYRQPAYAPALVDFVVVGAVAGAVAGIVADAGDHGGHVGWIPLGPDDPYRPSFAAGRDYMRRVDFGGIDNSRKIAVINNVTVIDNYANRNALTVMPAAAMARSEPVGHAGLTGAAALAAAGQGGGPGFQAVPGALPVRPVAGTRGVTPAVAQRFGLAALPARATAPGPAVDPQLFRPHELPAGRTPFRNGAALPAAAPSPAAGLPAGVPHPRPVAPLPPGPAKAGPIGAAVRPEGLPGLRAPGTIPPGLPAAHPAAMPSRPVAGHEAPHRPPAPAPQAGHPAAPVPLRRESAPPARAPASPAHPPVHPPVHPAAPPRPQPRPEPPREAPHAQPPHPPAPPHHDDRHQDPHQNGHDHHPG